MFSDQDIEEVFNAEVGGFCEGASRLTVTENGKVEKVGVFHRPLERRTAQRKPRCQHIFVDGKQCTYTTDMCPGHKGQKNWRAEIGL